MSGFVDALLGAQANGGGIGGSTKAVPVGRAGAKAPSTVSTSSGTGNKSGKGIALVFGTFIFCFSAGPTADRVSRTQILRVLRKATLDSKPSVFLPPSLRLIVLVGSTLKGMFTVFEL